METTPVKPNTSDPCDPAPTCAANERLITVQPDSSAGECCPTYQCFKGCWEVQTLNGVDTYIQAIVHIQLTQGSVVIAHWFQWCAVYMYGKI